MKNIIKAKNGNYQLTLKRLISLILIVTFSFASIAPVYASREGNFGSSSAFSQFISGAYSGAQASSTGSWGDTISSMATSVVVEAVDLWYYVNYYNDYGKALVSFEIGGTRVDISRGQMVRMVGSIAANAMVGLARGGYNDTGKWAENVAYDMWNQAVSLMIQEAIRDILVRRYGMDPVIAGIISGIFAQMLASLLRAEDMVGFVKEVRAAEAAKNKAEKEEAERSRQEGKASKESKESDSDEKVIGVVAILASEKAKKHQETEDEASYMIKSQAVEGVTEGKIPEGVFTKGEVAQGIRNATVVRDRYQHQLNSLNRNPWHTRSEREKRRNDLENKIAAANNIIGGLSKIQSQLETGESVALSSKQMAAVYSDRFGVIQHGQKEHKPGVITRAITNFVISAAGLVKPDAESKAREALKPKAEQGYRLNVGQPLGRQAKASSNANSDTIIIGDKDRTTTLATADNKPVGKLEDGRIFRDRQSNQEWIAIVAPGQNVKFAPVVRSMELQDGTKLTLPNNEPIRKLEVGQTFNGDNGKVYKVTEKTLDGRVSFDPIPSAAQPVNQVGRPGAALPAIIPNAAPDRNMPAKEATRDTTPNPVMQAEYLEYGPKVSEANNYQVADTVGYYDYDHNDPNRFEKLDIYIKQHYSNTNVSLDPNIPVLEAARQRNTGSMDANTTAAAPYVEPQRFQMEPADKDTARRVKAEFNRIAEKTGSMPPFVSLDGTTYYRSPGVAKMTRTTVLDNSTTTNTVTDTSAPSGTDTKAAIPIIR